MRIEKYINLEKTSNKINLKEFFSTYAIVVVLILICVVLTFTSDNFLTEANIINIFMQVSVNGILAVGMTFVILTGGIDLSVGALVALSGVIAAGFIKSGQPLIVVLLVAVGVSTLLGVISGLFIAKWNLAPFVITLGMMTIARGLTYVYTDGKPISDLSQAYLNIGTGSWLNIPIPIWILIFTFVAGFLILNFTNIGRYIYAVGGNEHAALVSGINVKFVKIFVYAISGIMCGIAAVVLSARVSAGLPQAGVGYELDAIAAVVIGGTSLSGGKGHMWGTVIGVLIIGIIGNGLDLLNVSSYYQQIVKGCIIVIAVLLDYRNNK